MECHLAPTASLGTQQPTEFWEDVYHSKQAGEKTDFPNGMVYISQYYKILISMFEGADHGGGV